MRKHLLHLKERKILYLPRQPGWPDMWVFLDDLEVAMQLLVPSTGSSQAVFDQFCEWLANGPLGLDSPI